MEDLLLMFDECRGADWACWRDYAGFFAYEILTVVLVLIYGND